MARPSLCLPASSASIAMPATSVPLSPELGIDRGQHVALVERVKNFGRAHDFEIAKHGALLRA